MRKKVAKLKDDDIVCAEKFNRKIFVMILRGIRYEPVIDASGVRNFHKRGYSFHLLFYLFGLRFHGSSFVTKTTTLCARPGNMPLKADGATPKEWVPRCIIRNKRKKIVLNAVGLSGLGLEFLIQTGWWQRLTEPFQISVMSLAPTPEGRHAELEGIFYRLAAAKKYEHWSADWGIQVNRSCPNGGLNPNDLIDEVIPMLEMANKALPQSISLTLKFGPEVHPRSMLRIANHRRCDALCFCNTLPFGKQPLWAQETPPVDWKELFGTDDPKESPMAKRFPGFAGGLSGAPLKPFVLEWLRAVRALGIQKPIIAGGGLLSANDAGLAFDAGADAISPGSVVMLTPTQVRPMIRGAREYARRRC